MAVAVFGLLYSGLPWWIDGARLRSLSAKDQAGILGADRGDVIKMVAGAGALAALVYTARKHTLDREGQVTDRYSKAIGQLVSERLSERVGGIYALERIMRDSARDHPTVVEVLAAFVRERAALDPSSRVVAGPPSGTRGVPTARERPEADVQAAMAVLGRRPFRDEPSTLDLRRTNLTGIELHGTVFGATAFNQADLTNASFSEARLYVADFTEATLVGANFSEAELDYAFLNGATLAGADLSGAILTEAHDLTPAQLAGAAVTSATVLTRELASDAWVQAQIKDCEGWTFEAPVPPPTPDPSAAAQSIANPS